MKKKQIKNIKNIFFIRIKNKIKNMFLTTLGATLISHLPSPLQLLHIGLYSHNHERTFNAVNFTLASASSIIEAEAMANQLMTSLVMWADHKQLAIAP